MIKKNYIDVYDIYFFKIKILENFKFYFRKFEFY